MFLLEHFQKGVTRDEFHDAIEVTMNKRNKCLAPSRNGLRFAEKKNVYRPRREFGKQNFKTLKEG